MAFVKADKASSEWINLDYVVRVDVSGDGEDRSVRVYVEGEPVPVTVASGLSVQAAEAEARRLTGDVAPKPRGPKARG